MTAAGEARPRKKTGPKPGPAKKRVIVRIHKALRAVLEDLADERGSRPATLLQQVVRRRMAAAPADYAASDEAAVYILTRTEGQVAAKQMTLYFTAEEFAAFAALAKAAGVTMNQLATCLLTDELVELGIV